MKRSTILAIVLACALGATNAFGQNYVWWEAEGLSPGAQVLNDGPGQTLRLYCDQAVQSTAIFRWHVTMRVANIEPHFGWSVDFASNDPTVSIADFDYLEPYFNDAGQFVAYLPFNGVNEQVSLGTGVDLMQDSLAGTIFAAPLALDASDGIAWEVFEFELVKSSGIPIDQPSRIFARTGMFGYGPEFGSLFDAIVGANSEIDIAQPLTEYAIPVITISGVGTNGNGDLGGEQSPWFVAPPPPPPPPADPVSPPPADPVTPPGPVDPLDPLNNPPPTEDPTAPPTDPGDDSNPDQPAEDQSNEVIQPPSSPLTDLTNAINAVTTYAPTVLPPVDQSRNGGLSGPLATPFGACGAMGMVSFTGLAFVAIGRVAIRKRRRR